jgi:Peptidase M50B-like
MNRNRFHQALLILSFIPLCWIGMMAVHELGHVIAAWLTGGTVTKVILHPLAISRTDVSPNPNPLLVVWGGPVIGVIAPLLIWLFFYYARSPLTYLARFFAGFCLIANGAYIGAGSFDRIGDTGEMLKHGTPVWFLWLFGLITFPIGLRLWHGLGVNFGCGESHE